MQQETRNSIDGVKEKIKKLIQRLMFMRDSIDTQCYYANLAYDSTQVEKLSTDMKHVDNVLDPLLKLLRIVDEYLETIRKKDRKDWHPVSAGFVWHGKIDIPYNLLTTDSTVEAWAGASLILGRLGGITSFTDIFVERTEFYNDGIRYNWSFNTMLPVEVAESLIQKAFENLRYTAAPSAERNAVDVAVEELNFFRNCHYNAPSGSTEYELANAINDILPLIVQFKKQRESCPQCGTHILPVPPGITEVDK